MKTTLKSFWAGIKIIFLYIKKMIKAILGFITRFVYMLLALGYIAGLVGVYYSQPYIKNYNQSALKYSQKASQAFQSIEAIKNVDKILEAKLKQRYDKVEDYISRSIRQIDEKRLARELILGKKLERTTFILGIKKSVYDAFKIDISDELNKVVSEQKNHPLLNMIENILSSSKIIHMIMLLLSFPAFSPLIIILVGLGMFSKRYLKYFSSPNQVNYLTMLPSLYVTNLILAIIAVTTFYFNQNIALAIAALAHLMFIWKVLNGIRLKNIGYCLSCSQELPKEGVMIKKIRENQKRKGKSMMKKPAAKKTTAKKAPAKKTVAKKPVAKKTTAKKTTKKK